MNAVSSTSADTDPPPVPPSTLICAHANDRDQDDIAGHLSDRQEGNILHNSHSQYPSGQFYLVIK